MSYLFHYKNHSILLSAIAQRVLSEIKLKNFCNQSKVTKGYPHLKKLVTKYRLKNPCDASAVMDAGRVLFGTLLQRNCLLSQRLSCVSLGKRNLVFQSSGTWLSFTLEYVIGVFLLVRRQLTVGLLVMFSVIFFYWKALLCAGKGCEKVH